MSSNEIDTIVLGVPCTIKFDYQPYEPPERGPEAQYPGCEEDVEITDVLVGGESVMEWFEDNEGMIECFTDAVYAYRKSEYEQWMEDRAERKWNDSY